MTTPKCDKCGTEMSVYTIRKEGQPLYCMACAIDAAIDKEVKND